jgi:FkbM family methyltransferase
MDDAALRNTPWPGLEFLRTSALSYAQNFEDARLARVFPGNEGFYVDIGAFEPVYQSVTKWFYERGWRGVNVEPQPEIFERLAADRPRDVNLNAGVARSAGVLTFYQDPRSPGLSTFREDVAAQTRAEGGVILERTVPVVTLAEICEQHVGAAGTFEFLKIDAEGLERAILEGGDWERWRPRVVLYENFPPDDAADFLEANGYTFAVFDGINKFYVRDEDRALIPALAAPFSALDEVVPYTLFRLIEKSADLGENTLAVARRLQRLSRRFPLAASIARRLMRKTA